MSGYESVTAAVLGASGYLGRWITRKLTEQGAHVCRIGREDVANLQTVYRRLRPSLTFNLAGYGVNPAGPKNLPVRARADTDNPAFNVVFAP